MRILIFNIDFYFNNEDVFEEPRAAYGRKGAFGDVMKQPTMKDVAKLAGVSQPTVSHVINGTASISDIVIQKVNDAIDELGYVPNVMAKSLKTNKSNLIGLIVPDVSIRFYAEMVKLVETALRQKGLMVFLCNTFYDRRLERKYVETLIQHNVLGVISGSSLLDDRSGELLAKNQIPVTLLDTSRTNEHFFNVNVDNKKLAHIAVSHLYSTGAHNISYVSEPTETSVLIHRYEYFIQALAEFGLKYDKQICFISPNQYETNNKMQLGYNLGANILMHDKIEAVFASSDEFAFGVMARLKEHGVDIPQQIPIMGCDNDPFSTLVSPSLTTIWQPLVQMSQAGVQRLLRLIDGETLKTKTLNLEPNIIIRESTMKIAKKAENL